MIPQAPHWPPRGLTGWLVCRWVRVDLDPAQADQRARIGLLQGVISMIVNTLLFFIKGVLGLLLGSVALLADAVHSLADSGSSLVVVVGSIWARKPRDSEHPFGHGRVELITALVIAILLIVMAFEFFRISALRLFQPIHYDAPLWVILVVVFTMLAKQWVTTCSRALATATQSPALRADYWHHFADVLSTGLVLIALIASRRDGLSLDAWAGIGVAAFILYIGIRTARDAISPLLGEAPHPTEVGRIEHAARSVKGVQGVHDLILHRYGDFRLMSLHIEVDAGLTALVVHDIAEKVEDEVERVMGGKAIVHVDPIDRSHPQYEQAEGIMEDVVADQQNIAEFHDLRLQGLAGHLHLTVDVVAVVGTKESAYPEIEARVCAAIQAAMPGVKDLQVRVETGYHPKAEP